MIVFYALLTVLMLTVIITDATRYIIPNWLNAAVLLLYPVMVLITPHEVPLLYALYSFLGVFACGVLLFAVRIMWGGDIKLLIALAPWVSVKAGPSFLIYMALLGGLLALALITLRPVAVWAYGKRGKLDAIPRVLTYKEPAPYGIAIALAFLIVLWMGLVPGLPLFSGAGV